MLRQARIILKNCPHHIVQRGLNRQPVFTGGDDYIYYIDNLREWKKKLGCKVYAYCLMTNHVHLIVDPGIRTENLGLSEEERAANYRQWLKSTVAENELQLIREAVQRGQLTGGKKFERSVSKKIGRRMELRGQGRPKKVSK